MELLVTLFNLEGARCERSKLRAKPSEAGSRGRGGARERSDGSLKGCPERRGLCDDEGP